MVRTFPFPRGVSHSGSTYWLLPLCCVTPESSQSVQQPQVAFGCFNEAAFSCLSFSAVQKCCAVLSVREEWFSTLKTSSSAIPLPKTESAIVGCSGLCTDSFWIPPRMENTPLAPLGNLPQCSVCLAVAKALFILKENFLVLEFMSATSHGHCATLRKVWHWILHTLPAGILREDLPQAFSSSGWAVPDLPVFSHGRCPSPSITFAVLQWTLFPISILGNPDLDTACQLWPDQCWVRGEGSPLSTCWHKHSRVSGL